LTVLDDAGYPQPVTTYVLVHGAWHGGWCWDPVAEMLAEAGHAVVAPTLTGLAERYTRVRPETPVGLSVHVDDVVSALESADLGDVVLVGHSYAGMVVVGAAARAADRVGHLVVVDGFLPEAGERAIDLLPPHAAAHYRESASSAGDGWQIPPRPLVNLGVTDEAFIAATAPRLTPHPLQTYLDAAVHGASELSVSGSYLLCSGWRSPFGSFADRARRLGWPVDEVDADHEVMLTASALLAGKLVDVPLVRTEAEGMPR
jgi:pimeloyl-ACP methyl ester carboxylesterase